MYELFVDNQRFFRRYFSLPDLAEDKKSPLEGCSSRGGRGRGDSGIALSQLVFGAIFALGGAACGSLAKIVEKTILEIFLFQLVLPSHFGQEIFYFQPRGETVVTQYFFSVLRIRFSSETYEYAILFGFLSRVVGIFAQLIIQTSSNRVAIRRQYIG